MSRTDAKRLWVLDADLEAAFDRLNHDHIRESLGMFPARGLVHQGLKAGVVEDSRFIQTEEGAPQGGVISPLLLNVALHGMEAAAGVQYYVTGTRVGKTRWGLSDGSPRDESGNDCPSRRKLYARPTLTR